MSTITDEKFGKVYSALCLTETELGQIDYYVQHLRNSFQLAENNISKLNNEILELEGMTGKKTRHFYNNLLELSDARYLEIGTWMGSSVCSAMYLNKAKVIVNDNWSQFSGPKNIFLENFNKYKGENEANFIESDCFDIDVSTLPKFNIYLYDGDHKNTSHFKALTHFYDCLDDLSIFVCDDWNIFQIRQATFEAIDKCKFNVIYEISKTNMIDGYDGNGVGPDGGEGWWNGIYACVLKKVPSTTYNRDF